MATTINAGTATGGAAISADTTGILALQSGSTPTTAVTIDTAQNVGIGTASPVNGANLTTLTVYNATQPALYLQNSTTGTAATDGLSIGMSGTDCYFNNRESGNIITYVNGSERMRIDSGGNLFLGGTSTTYGSKFTIYSSGGGNIIESKQTGSGSQYHVIYMNSNGAVGSIQTSGSNTSYVTSSDYRLKEDIAPMTGALAIVSTLKPVTYKWKTDGSSGQGFIAHELQEIVPEAVAGAKDGVETVDDVDAEGKVIGTKEVPKYQGIDTSFLVATLTAAIQELNAKVDAQSAEIKALKGVA